MERLKSELAHHIRQQISDNENRNLLYRGAVDEFSICPEFVRILLEAKGRGLRPEPLLDWLTKRILARIYGINQFLQMNRKGVESLSKIYTNSYARITEKNHKLIFREHYGRLQNWISDYFPDDYRKQLGNAKIIGRIMNSEYSSAFQCRVFGFDEYHPAEPILDLGCGPNGGLVKHFLHQGKPAWGIDRLIEDNSCPYLIETDWFDFHFTGNHWGTIIANMSFTNHLQHALEETTSLREYAQKYKEILGSLLPGGCFFYAPSVLPIEERLEGSLFKVNRRWLNGVGITCVRKILSR